jgi:hypothetical protein
MEMPSNFVTRLELHDKLTGIKFKSPAGRMEYLVDFLSQRLNFGQHDDAMRSLREFIRVSSFYCPTCKGGIEVFGIIKHF